jgi:hypothetical protein
MKPPRMIQNISIVKVLDAIEIGMPVAYTMSILRSSKDTSRRVLVHSRVTKLRLHSVMTPEASFTLIYDAYGTGITYNNHHMMIIICL